MYILELLKRKENSFNNELPEFPSSQYSNLVTQNALNCVTKYENIYRLRTCDIMTIVHMDVILLGKMI